MLLQRGQTALHGAASQGKLPIVEALVRAGSDIAAVDKVSARVRAGAGWARICASTFLSVLCFLFVFYLVLFVFIFFHVNLTRLRGVLALKWSAC